MVDFKVDWNKRNVWDFVKYSTLFRTKMQRIMFITYFVCCAVVLVMGIVAYIATKELYMLIIALAVLVIFLIYSGAVFLMMKSFAKKILKENEGGETTVSITDLDIMVYEKGEFIGKVDWSSVSQISVVKDAVYIITKENALLLLEYSNIIHGERAEFDRIIGEKNAELSKKA